MTSRVVLVGVTVLAMLPVVLVSVVESVNCRHGGTGAGWSGRGRQERRSLVKGLTTASCEAWGKCTIEPQTPCHSPTHPHSRDLSVGVEKHMLKFN